MKIILRTKRHYMEEATRVTIPLNEIKKMVEANIDILVLQLPTKVDITSATLLQILALAERDEQKLPCSLLAELIRYRVKEKPVE